MKGKILFADVSKDGLTTTVVKQTKYGIYSGEVTVVEEDLPIHNKWDGYAFAEYKCDLQFVNEKAKRLYEQYVGIKNAYQTLLQSVPEDDDTMVRLRRQMYLAKRDAKNARKRYIEMKGAYVPYTNQILKQRKRIRDGQLLVSHE